jgi:hypothetical protein
MYKTVDLGITIDKPTKNGNIWAKAAVEKAVQQINKKTPMNCYFMLEMANLGDPAIKILGAEITDEGEFKIHIETTSMREGQIAESLIRDDKIKFQPIIETNHCFQTQNNQKLISDIIRFKKMGIETNSVIRDMISKG